jgi:hypothetical protein
MLSGAQSFQPPKTRKTQNMRANLLHVVAVVSNPIRWESRIRLYRDFEQHMLDSGVNLTVVECAFGERPFEIAPRDGVNLVRVRSKTIVWNKESLINRGIQALPDGWKYVAWIDADVIFRRSHWAVETVQALQQYDIVQPWSDAYDLGPNDEHIQHHKSFLSQWWHKQPVVPTGAKCWKFIGGPYDYPHPGYAWAATREAIAKLGGLFDLAAMGAGDHHMALALVGEADRSLPGPNVSKGYRDHLKRWEWRAVNHIAQNMGFVHGTIEHRFHGRKTDRKYVDRWQMILEHGFDPDTDLKRNVDGILELACNKPDLRHDIDIYFRQRNEDVNSLV